MLSRITDEAPGTDHGFYDGLCAAICRQTSIDRAAIFRYDGAHRRVRAAGTEGIDISVFDGLFASVECSPTPAARCEDDVVVETRDFAGVPPEFEQLVEGRRSSSRRWSPAGRWIGVVVGDRPADAPPLGDDERHLLWTLGKTAALAAMARIATSQAQRARELEERIDLARDIHDGAIQRLFGVSLALAGDGRRSTTPRGSAAPRSSRPRWPSCATAVQRPLRRAPRADAARRSPPSCARLARRAPGARASSSKPAIRRDVPRAARGAGPVGASSRRSATRRSTPSPRHVEVRVGRDDGAFVLDVANDGVGGAPRGLGDGAAAGRARGASARRRRRVRSRRRRAAGRCGWWFPMAAERAGAAGEPPRRCGC